MILFKADPRWTGFSRHTPLAAAVNLSLTAIVFIMSIVQSVQLSNAKNSAWNLYGGALPPSSSTVVYYENTGAFISFGYLTAIIVLHSLAKASPIPSLVAAVVYFCGWIAQIYVWSICDYTNEIDYKVCYKWPRILENGDSYIVSARIAFGVLCLLGSGILMGLSIVAAVSEKREGRVLEQRQKESGESHEL